MIVPAQTSKTAKNLSGNLDGVLQGSPDSS